MNETITYLVIALTYGPLIVCSIWSVVLGMKEGDE